MSDRLIVCTQCGGVNRLPEQRSALQAKCGKCGARIFDGHPADVGGQACPSWRRSWPRRSATRRTAGRRPGLVRPRLPGRRSELVSGFSTVRTSSGSRPACARSATPRSTPSSAATYVTQMTAALNRGDTFFAYRGYLGMSGWTPRQHIRPDQLRKAPFRRDPAPAAPAPSPVAPHFPRRSCGPALRRRQERPSARSAPRPSAPTRASTTASCTASPTAFSPTGSTGWAPLSPVASSSSSSTTGASRTPGSSHSATGTT